MNEITRIHIAKVAYDIEVNAKKQLKNILKALKLTHKMQKFLPISKYALLNF